MRIAPLRSASVRSAWVRIAPLRFAVLRFANLRSASVRSASLRFTPLRFTLLRSASQSGTKSPRVYPGVFAARSPPPRGRGMTADITKRERQYKPYARIGPVRTCAGGAQ